LIAKSIVRILLYAIELTAIEGGLLSLGVPAYPWEFFGIDCVTDLPRSGSHGYTSLFIMVCHLAKMAPFVPCLKEFTAEETIELFIDKCYRLHGVPKVIVYDRHP